MGEYAEMAMERDWESQFYPQEDYYDCGGIDVIRSASKQPKWKDEGLPYITKPIGKPILLRQYKHNLIDLKINCPCVVKKETEKAVLFRATKEWEPELTKEIEFWLPKSVLYLRENELAVVYVKKWATIQGSEVMEKLEED